MFFGGVARSRMRRYQSIRWRRTESALTPPSGMAATIRAFLHDVGAVAQSENGVEILFHEQDCGAEFPTEGAKGCTDQLHD